MGDGRLDWRQSRANSRILVVDQEAVIAMVRAQPLTLPTSKQPKDNRPKMIDGGRPMRGGIRTDHHLRLTLPFPNSDNPAAKKKTDPGSSPG